MNLIGGRSLNVQKVNMVAWREKKNLMFCRSRGLQDIKVKMIKE